MRSIAIATAPAKDSKQKINTDLEVREIAQRRNSFTARFIKYRADQQP